MLTDLSFFWVRVQLKTDNGAAEWGAAGSAGLPPTRSPLPANVTSSSSTAPKKGRPFDNASSEMLYVPFTTPFLCGGERSTLCT